MDLVKFAIEAGRKATEQRIRLIKEMDENIIEIKQERAGDGDCLEQ